jgi:hypothetical protein
MLQFCTKVASEQQQQRLSAQYSQLSVLKAVEDANMLPASVFCTQMLAEHNSALLHLCSLQKHALTASLHPSCSSGASLTFLGTSTVRHCFSTVMVHMGLQIFLQGASDMVTSGTCSFLMDRSTDTWGADSTATPADAAAVACAAAAGAAPLFRLRSRLALRLLSSAKRQQSRGSMQHQRASSAL